MVMAKVRACIWSEAPTALLFRAPTIRGLAQEIEAAKGSVAQKTDLAIPRAPFTDAQRAAGVEVLPVQADLLEPKSADRTESQVFLALLAIPLLRMVMRVFSLGLVRACCVARLKSEILGSCLSHSQHCCTC